MDDGTLRPAVPRLYNLCCAFTMNSFAYFDGAAFLLTLRLALLVAVSLLAASLPLAWWLTASRWRGRFLVEALVALPLVLPPTVLGFYLLVAMGTNSPVGRWWIAWTGHPLAFTFTGLVVGSLFYSLPFAVQPLVAAFSAIPPRLLAAAATLGASPFSRFYRVALPLAWPGVLSAATLAFAHTVGEFGVVLMIGGNIPGVTRTASIAIYDQVQAGEYSAAHANAFTLLLVSFVALALVYGITRRGTGLGASR